MPAAGEPVYLVRRDLGRARDESPLHRVEALTSLRDLGPAILDVAGDIKTLGLEFDVLPVANYQRTSARSRRGAARLHARAAAAAGAQVGVGGGPHPRRRRADPHRPRRRPAAPPRRH